MQPECVGGPTSRDCGLPWKRGLQRYNSANIQPKAQISEIPSGLELFCSPGVQELSVTNRAGVMIRVEEQLGGSIPNRHHHTIITQWLQRILKDSRQSKIRCFRDVRSPFHPLLHLLTNFYSANFWSVSHHQNIGWLFQWESIPMTYGLCVHSLSDLDE